MPTITFEVTIRAPESMGCSREDLINQFVREIKYEYPGSSVEVEDA